MPHKRYIGLDFGEKTIGVAISCPDAKVATGVTTLRRENEAALRPCINQLRDIIKQYSITNIVLGHPINMDGSISMRAEKTAAFKDKLKRNFKSIDITLWDERLSTSAVTRAFYSGNDSRSKKKRTETYRAHVDEMAAVYILQGYLNSQLEDFMENENLLPDEHEDLGEIIVVTDDEGNEYPLHVLSSKEHNGFVYLLAAVASEEDDDDDTAEVLHFRCTLDDSDDEDMSMETVDETHEDFELVMELFKADYEELGITIDEGDLPLGV